MMPLPFADAFSLLCNLGTPGRYRTPAKHTRELKVAEHLLGHFPHVIFLARLKDVALALRRRVSVVEPHHLLGDDLAADVPICCHGKERSDRRGKGDQSTWQRKDTCHREVGAPLSYT